MGTTLKVANFAFALQQLSWDFCWFPPFFGENYHDRLDQMACRAPRGLNLPLFRTMCLMSSFGLIGQEDVKALCVVLAVYIHLPCTRCIHWSVMAKDHLEWCRWFYLIPSSLLQPFLGRWCLKSTLSRYFVGCSKAPMLPIMLFKQQRRWHPAAKWCV